MRENFNVEKALRISKENSDTLHVDILFGSVLPGEMQVSKMPLP